MAIALAASGTVTNADIRRITLTVSGGSVVATAQSTYAIDTGETRSATVTLDAGSIAAGGTVLSDVVTKLATLLGL